MGLLSGIQSLEPARFLERIFDHERSAQKGRAIRGNRQPLPWFTYPAIDNLRELDLLA
jgi:hypothetical protein